MSLESPFINKRYKSFKALKADMQQHTHKQEYTIITKHSKKDKKNKHVIKVILMCNQGQKQYINFATTYLNTILQNTECLFTCYIVNKKHVGNWIFIVTNSDYNHFESFHSFAHAIYYIANFNNS